MEITKVVSEKKKYQDLLLLADEQENMIDKYLDRGEAAERCRLDRTRAGD